MMDNAATNRRPAKGGNLVRKHSLRSSVVLSFGLILFCLVGVTYAQEGTLSSGAKSATAAAPNTSLVLQYYLLVGSNGGGESPALPSGLGAVAREIRANLLVNQVRVGATFQHRADGGGRLEIKGVAASVFTSAAPNSQGAPTFYESNTSQLKIVGDGAQSVLQLDSFRFGLRIPIQTVGAGGVPNVNYESVGIAGGVSIPLGEPTVVGSLSVGRPDETLILVLLVKRAGTR
jgi:hypothetical protein